MKSSSPFDFSAASSEGFPKSAVGAGRKGTPFLGGASVFPPDFIAITEHEWAALQEEAEDPPPTGVCGSEPLVIYFPRYTSRFVLDRFLSPCFLSQTEGFTGISIYLTVSP